MNRAVAIDVGDIGGPNHGIFSPSGTPRSASASAVRAGAPAGQQRRRGGSRGDLERRVVDVARSGRRWPRSTSASQRLLVGAPRRARASSVQAGGRPGWRRPSRRRAWACASRPSSRPATSASSRSPSAVEVGEHARSSRSFIAAVLQRTSSRIVGPAGRGSGARRRVSSVIVSARPRPRTRSRVACTSSRAPGATRRRRAPRRSAGGSRGRPLLERRDRGEQLLVGAGRDPQLQRGGEDRRGEVVAEHPQRRPGSGPAPRGSRPAAGPSSAPRSSVRCSTAATTRSFLVGKWCSWAPRETPARSETSVVEVPEKPRSTSSSTVASSSRSRIARVRSACGTRVGRRHPPSSPPRQQTVKPDFLLDCGDRPGRTAARP